MDSGISGAELSGSVTSVLAHTILLMLLPVMKTLSERCRLWARASNTEAEYSNGRQRDREQCSQLLGGAHLFYIKHEILGKINDAHFPSHASMYRNYTLITKGYDPAPSLPLPNSFAIPAVGSHTSHPFLFAPSFQTLCIYFLSKSGS